MRALSDRRSHCVVPNSISRGINLGHSAIRQTSLNASSKEFA